MIRNSPQFSDILIREAEPDDLPLVVSIERAANEQPWTAEIFRDELRRGTTRLLMLYDLPKTTPVAFIAFRVEGDEATILNISTHPTQRRRGFGRMLLSAMLERTQERGVRYVTLEVRRSNLAAQALYRQLAFRSIGVRPGYYQPGGEDAIVMILQLEGRATKYAGKRPRT